MTVVRKQWRFEGQQRPGLVSWVVLKTCEQAFETELLAIHAIQQLAVTAAEHGFWWGLFRAGQFYDLQYAIYLRRKGAAVAARFARYSVKMLLLPRCIGLRLAVPAGADLKASTDDVY